MNWDLSQWAVGKQAVLWQWTKSVMAGAGPTVKCEAKKQGITSTKQWEQCVQGNKVPAYCGPTAQTGSKKKVSGQL
jgi:hypothetical protein